MDLNIALDRVRDIVYRACSLGTRGLDNGTELVGHMPHVAPEACLHILFSGLEEAQVESLGHALKTPIPPAYRSFLNRMNGLSLFSRALSLDGLRVSYARTGDAMWQPFNLVDANTLERPAGARPTDFVIGGYTADGSVLCIDSTSGETWRRDRDAPKPLNRWASIGEMLASEVDRLATHFDERGKRLDPRVPTTPRATED